ncbi:hypothetical protein N7456_007332 [Penicillium angulare]|uniref:Major facilitator superfamily (MFS) profile domain-containing protein n=1 Tax=Penicillium angulare TaxID=116970 RepID=A0A9W9FAL6_9EURO|nr:hypothetical protein N7456_007332 [Penicillium angulare]
MASIDEGNAKSAPSSETEALLESQSLLAQESADYDTYTWVTWRKIAVLAVVSFACFNDVLGASIVTPAVPQIMEDFHVSNPSLSNLLVTVHVIGFAIGPLFVSPASELWGRDVLMHASNFIFLASTIACAISPDIPVLIASRVIMGMAGTIPSVVEGGYIADLVPLQNRGKFIAIWTLSPLIGAVVGPIIGGFMALKTGWRSVFWFMTIPSGLQAVASIFVLRKTDELSISQQTGNNEEEEIEDPAINRWSLFKNAFTRPAKLALESPIVITSALNITMGFVIFYFMISNLPVIYSDMYGFNSAQIGLAYMSPTIGCLLAISIVGFVSDIVLERRMIARGKSKPTDRLFLLIPSNIVIAVGTICYGWSLQANLHWIIPLIAIAFTNVGVCSVMLSIHPFLTDYFGSSVPNAIAVSNILRSAFGALLPLASAPLYRALGYGWGNSFLGLIALSFTSTAWILHKSVEQGNS